MQEEYRSPRFTASFDGDNAKLADVKFAFLMHPSECLSNARLIAVAPEMFEVAVKLNEHLNSFFGISDSDEAGNPVHDELRAVIAKAKGKA